MRATTPNVTTGYTLEIVNDLYGSRTEITSPCSRGEIIENLLFLVVKHERDEAPEHALCACVHIYPDKVVLHFFAAPGREKEALAALKEGGFAL